MQVAVDPKRMAIDEDGVLGCVSRSLRIVVIGEEGAISMWVTPGVGQRMVELPITTGGVCKVDDSECCRNLVRCSVELREM
jgi:hypothetical protein